MARLYADEQFPVAIVYHARHSGIISCPEPAAKHFKKVARQIDTFLKRNDMNSRFERLPHV